MSWINLNDSLSSIKGQITNLASNILADEQETDTDKELTAAKARITELEKACENFQKEVETLREVNVASVSSPSNNITSNCDASTATEDNDNDAQLSAQLAQLQLEKHQLESSLDELDRNHQDNLLALKAGQQQELDSLKQQSSQLQQACHALQLSPEDLLRLASQDDEEDGVKQVVHDLRQHLRQLGDGESVKKADLAAVQWLRRAEELGAELGRRGQAVHDYRAECDQLMANNERLIEELEAARRRGRSLDTIPEEQKPQCSQELETAKSAYAELHSQLEVSQNECAELNSQLEAAQNECAELHSQLEVAQNKCAELHSQLEAKQSNCTDLQAANERLEQQLAAQESGRETSQTALEEKLAKAAECEAALRLEADQLRGEVRQAAAAREELLQLVKDKHEESVRYHGEIQRLSQALSEAEERSQRDQQQSARELDRLRAHLLEVQDGHAAELLAAEGRAEQMAARLAEEAELRRSSSTVYTSASIRANQQVETLANQVQLMTERRAELQVQLAEAEERAARQEASLTNLQCVLEQFQRDKERDIVLATERVRRQVDAEQRRCQTIEEEAAALRALLEERNQGLQAAGRLTDQLRRSEEAVASLRSQVSDLEAQLAASEATARSAALDADQRIDKALLRNLVTGFCSQAGGGQWPEKQAQVLRIIATVLDMSDEEKLRIGLVASGSSGGSSSVSLSEAFIRFLETESAPKQPLPALPQQQQQRRPSSQSNASSSASATAPQPALVLPTFNDYFAQNRNSSSILKDVLKQPSQSQTND